MLLTAFSTVSVEGDEEMDNESGWATFICVVWTSPSTSLQFTSTLQAIRWILFQVLAATTFLFSLASSASYCIAIHLMYNVLNMCDSK